MLIAIGDRAAENQLVRAARRRGIPVYVAERPLVSDFTPLAFIEQRPFFIGRLRAPESSDILHSINWLYSLSGFAVGVLVGFTGVGGGSLMTPLLVLLFGIHPGDGGGHRPALCRPDQDRRHGWSMASTARSTGASRGGSRPGSVPATVADAAAAGAISASRAGATTHLITTVARLRADPDGDDAAVPHAGCSTRLAAHGRRLDARADRAA